MGTDLGIIRRLATLGTVALTACTGFAWASPAAAQSAKIPRALALIDVTVASLWAKPSQPRPIDAPSLANPVRLGSWLGAMTTAQREWLTNHLTDQGLYGQQVAIWKRRGRWDKISLTGQATSRGFSYPGWVPARQLTPPTPITAGTMQIPPVPGPEAVVDVPKAWLYEQATTGGRGPRLLHLSFNTRLPELGQNGSWTTVRTPGGASALIASSSVVVRDPATPPPPPTGQQLVKTAEMFLALPYLWAGTSAYGFDCSGLTYTVYDFYGIVLPRNSAGQARVGRRVRLRALKPGDLLFFRTDPPSRLISHVTMYVGGGRMIESPHSGAAVHVIRLSKLMPYYAGARRYVRAP